MLKVPSREELYPAVTSYLQNLNAIIMYTYTYEDGYWTTHWKWDGSEDSFVSGTQSSSIEYSKTEIFPIKNVCMYYGYSEDTNYRNDEMSKEDVFLEVYSSIKNSKKLWTAIVNGYNRKERELLGHLIDDTYKSALSAILEYLTKIFPIYGKIMYDWAEEWKGKHSFHISSCDLDSFLSHGTPLFSRMERILGSDMKDKYEKYNRPDIRGVDAIRLKEQLLSINLYLCQRIANVLEKNYISHIELSVYDTETIDREGMLLSIDEKTIYGITGIRLQEITIPSTVTHIGDGAFFGCKQLKKIQFLGVVTHIGHDAFRGVQADVYGDFSKISFFGYNTSRSKITINGETKAINEWSYLYNKKTIDDTDITMKKIHIEHEDE